MFSVIDFNIFSTIVVWENIRSSIMRSDDQGNSTHTHLNLSLVSHNLATQPQHELLRDVVADLFRAPSIRTSHQGKPVLIEKRTLILVLPPSPCPVSSPIYRLAGVALLCTEVNSLYYVFHVSRKLSDSPWSVNMLDDGYF